MTGAPANDPSDRATLAEVLLARAGRHPGRRAYVMLADGEREEGTLTCGALRARAAAVAAQLVERCAPGDRALIVLPAGLDYPAAFYGCLLAGVVAVPAYPPRRSRSPERILSIAADCSPRVGITTRALAPSLAGALAATASFDWIAVEDIAPDDPAGLGIRVPGPGDLAFLQYTSGSIASPKGVRVTHANLMANQRMIRAAFHHGEDSHVASWLPLYHDMGLVGNAMQPLFCGAMCVLMAPEAFLMRPARWLRAISAYRCATSGGPNFAYDLCAQRIRPEQCSGLDLSCWTLAYNGSEPVRAETMERFARRFEPSGFRRAALRPCYGLAEATLMATICPPREKPRVLHVDGDALGRNRVEIVSRDAAGARALVSCGTAPLGAEVRAEGGEAEVGEIVVSGPHVADGYWNKAGETAEAFPGGGTLRTGDLGFVYEGELYVTGRMKDLIIVAGRNHYPADLELTAEGAHPSIRQGGCCAFATEGEGGEGLAVLAEVDRGARGGTDWERMRAAIREALAEEHEVRADRIEFLQAGSLPRTTSGKLRRLACREMIRAGQFDFLAE